MAAKDGLLNRSGMELQEIFEKKIIGAMYENWIWQQGKNREL